MKTCSKCNTNPALSYHAYCYGCLRISRNQSPVPKYHRDASNKTLCCRCKVAPRLPYHGYCAACVRAFTKAFIKKQGGDWAYALKRGQRQKVLARRLAGHRVTRGHWQRQPCQVCGEKAQMHHHHGYDDAHKLDVIWLCPKHHREAEKKILLLTDSPDKV